MTDRVKALKAALENVEQRELCTEKVRYIIDSYSRNEGLPLILRRAVATADYMANKKIFIQDGELIVGNMASVPMGIEVSTNDPSWPDDDLDSLVESGAFVISEESRQILRDADQNYWEGKSRTFNEAQARFLDDDRMWPFIQSGILLPPVKDKKAGYGRGGAGEGWSVGYGQTLFTPDYEVLLTKGLGGLIDDCRAELKQLRFRTKEDIEKCDFLNAAIISMEALIGIAERFSALAADMAAKEANPVRKKELEEISAICAWVPRNPARTLREALQSFWFFMAANAFGTIPGGRTDQLFYPYYRKDIDEGRITDEEVIELFELLRIKVMEMNFLPYGAKDQRDKWAGNARWNNFVIGGCDADGNDASNELSYIVLEAALRCQTPHHTITLRVNEHTPEKLMQKAIELVKTGCGMPAFISDDSYIGYLVDNGVDLKMARNYCINGCLDISLPGRSRISAVQMFVMPRVFLCTLNNGVDVTSGDKLGIDVGSIEDFKTYDDLLAAFKKEMHYFVDLMTEQINFYLYCMQERCQNALMSILAYDAVKVGRDILDRPMPYETAGVHNCVGMISIANSLAAIKKLVYDEKKVTLAELKKAMDANWEGYEELHRMCVEAPKYGNGNEYVDNIAADIYGEYADYASTTKSIYGPIRVSGISITAHAPGGAMTAATPDGRYTGETFADGSLSPAQGDDTNGPTAVLKSAMTIDQRKFSATLLNMKFAPSALQTESDCGKLSSLIRTYFNNGGKHIQFNVVDKATLEKAKETPKEYKNLMVRVAGYSTYFTILTDRVQNEIIARTSQTL